MRKGPQCEFISQNETYLNEHMTKVHAELRKKTDQEKVLRKCPQCDFPPQNETYFNEHMTKVHSGQPNSLFCFIAFKNYSTVRKHCETVHRELKKKEEEHKSHAERKKPVVTIIMDKDSACLDPAPALLIIQ